MRQNALANIKMESSILFNPGILISIILVEGFVSIATEILAIRQLLPVAGGSVIVTSLVIGFFLLFLALGYQRGGKIKHDPIGLLRKNFFIAANCLGIGLSYLFISLFFTYSHRYLGPHIIYPLIAYLILVIAPLIFLLGQTLPITMNMIRQTETAGTIGGYALSLSTVGSFLGSILTSLVTLHYFGVAYTVIINAVLLLLLSLLLQPRDHRFLLSIIAATASAAVIFLINVNVEKSLFVLTNSYANYQIIPPTLNDLSQQKILVINEAYSSRVDYRGRGFTYIEIIKKILFSDLKLRGEEILVLGAGGFSLTAESTYDNHVTYVDIDPQIKNVAVPKFINQLNSEFIADDARHFLKTSDKKYAAIVVDVYSDFKAIPAHLVTAEYLQAIKEKLKPQGTAVLNIVANPMLTDAYSKHLDNTIRAVFQSCMAYPQTYANHVSNIIYLCQAGQRDNLIYSDNINRSTTDSFNW